MLLPDFYVIESIRIHNIKKVFEIQVNTTPSNFDLYPGNIGESIYDIPLDEEFYKYKVDKWYKNQLESYHNTKHIFNNKSGWTSDFYKQKYEDILKKQKHIILPILDVFIERKAIQRL